ncbi:MAG: four helix bundle protein [Candidatus Taylorbacteria bacterium]|nr:four helix bundle protein [Candidatus Taylorbacteria bacterium]
MREFTDLKVWQESHKLVILIYKETKSFPREEIFGLTSQMRRAAVSVSSNIAEGFGRQSYKEKVQFYYLAHGSLVELKNQLFIARDILYITVPHFETLMEQVAQVQRLLQGLISKSKTFI